MIRSARIRSIWIAFGSAVLVSPAASDILRVPDEFASIRAAIDVAGSRDVVLVAPGDYDSGSEAVFISPGVSVRSEAGAGATTWEVWGGIEFVDGEAEHPTELSGFQLIYGTASSGAVACWFDSCVVRDNVFLDVDSYGWGGSAVYCGPGSTIEISGNLISHGGHDAVYVEQGASATLVDNVFCTCTEATGRYVDVEWRARSVELVHNTFGGPGFVTIDTAPQAEPRVSVYLSSNLFFSDWTYSGVTCIGDYPGGVEIYAEYNLFQLEDMSGCGGTTLGPGNVFELEDAMYCDWACDLSLHANSPAVGAGAGGSNAGALGIGCGVVSVPGAASVDASLTLSPNPARGALSIGLPPAYDGVPLILNVHDAAGRLVDRRAGNGPEIRWPGRIRGEVAPRGVYFVDVRTLGGRSIAKGRATLIP